MKKIFLYLIVCMCSNLLAQNVSYDFYSFRLGNMFNVNPAYCTKDDGVNIIMNAQSQNTGVSYSNKNIMAGVYSRITKHQGLGLKLISDTRGAFQVLKADVSYAYLAKFAERNTLSLGLSAGIDNANLTVNRIENFQLLDQTDPTLTNNYLNTTQFSSGIGALYTFRDLDVSVSLPHIIATSRPFNSYVNTAVFYTFKLGDKFKLQPWVNFQNIPITNSLGSLFVKGSFKDLVWLQAGYQTNQSFLAALGTSFENINLSYGFRTSNSDFTLVSTGVHEITFSIRINKRMGKQQNSSSASTLDNLTASLDRLLESKITAENKIKIREELEKIKIELRKVEVENTSAENSNKVQEQLIKIDDKLKQLEKKLLDE